MTGFTSISAMFGFVAAAKLGRKIYRGFWQKYGKNYMYNDAKEVTMMLQRARREGWLNRRDYFLLFDKLWLAVEEGDRTGTQTEVWLDYPC